MITKEPSEVEKKFINLTNEILKECGYELYDLDYVNGSSTLRVFIMDPKTQTAEITDCVTVDRAFSPFCEELDWIPDNFVLEVSSPGVYRVLKTKAHFEYAVDKLISCTITGKLEGESYNELPAKLIKGNKFRGLLTNILANEIVINLDGHELPIKFEQIKKAHLDPDING